MQPKPDVSRPYKQSPSSEGNRRVIRIQSQVEPFFSLEIAAEELGKARAIKECDKFIDRINDSNGGGIPIPWWLIAAKEYLQDLYDGWPSAKILASIRSLKVVTTAANPRYIVRVKDRIMIAHAMAYLHSLNKDKQAEHDYNKFQKQIEMIVRNLLVGDRR